VQGIHHQYQDPLAWRPDRYMPGGEYDQFDAAIRPYMVGGGADWGSGGRPGRGHAWPPAHRLPRWHHLQPQPAACLLPPPPLPQFLPFIQGPRNCLGQYFALLENRVLLSVLSQRFTFTPVDAAKAGVTHPSVIPVAPLNGMKMYVE
jgi:cytochrome P450